ncbi:MAG: glucosamine-6-phosphate deaminase [Brooklawnia sp.]|jgi:glucosamine-6-phosphate deaminase
MEIVIAKDPAEVGRLAAARVAGIARRVGPSVVLGLATGSSPLALYIELAAMVRAGTLDLSEATAFALDEYVGLPAGHPESYAEVIRTTVTEPLQLRPSQVHVPDGWATDLDAAARSYDQAIKDVGGVDVQILGMGTNGHIGFNEPASSLTSRTRVKTLSPRTRADNARFFDGDIGQVPTLSITQGLGTIMDARELVMVAHGPGKADAVAKIIEGPITAAVPGSIMQVHQRALVVIDDAAASKLTQADYYRYLFTHKPEWQRLLAENEPAS